MASLDAIDLICHRCGAVLMRGEGSFYVVNIEAFADPSPPNFECELSLEEMVAEYEELIASMSDQSEQELMDQVYRRLRILLCAGCYRRWIDNPAP